VNTSGHIESFTFFLDRKRRTNLAGALGQDYPDGNLWLDREARVTLLRLGGYSRTEIALSAVLIAVIVGSLKLCASLKCRMNNTP
jgi:hypothetical protein